MKTYQSGCMAEAISSRGKIKKTKGNAHFQFGVNLRDHVFFFVINSVFFISLGQQIKQTKVWACIWNMREEDHKSSKTETGKGEKTVMKRSTDRGEEVNRQW